MRQMNGHLAALMALGLAASITGCGQSRETGEVTSKSGGQTTVAPPAAVVEERDHALIRAVNAVPGRPALTIYAGDSAAFRSVAYRKATGYKEIPDDLFNFEIKAGDRQDGASLASNRQKLADGGHYTVVALPSEDKDDLNLRILDDGLKPVTSGKARARFVNGMAGDTDVDLFVRGQEDPLFDGVNFKAESGWKEVDPVAGTLVVKPDNKSNTLATLAGANLEAGKSYTFVLVGRPGKYEIVQIQDEVASAPQ
jgi:hypothetical protein